MARSVLILLCIATAALLLLGPAPAAAGEALPSWQLHAGAEASERHLVEDLEAALSAGLAGPFAVSVGRDLAPLGEALAPTLASLSTGPGGRFGSTAIRYALHRLFIRLRGWSIIGLDPEGQAWNGTWVEKVTLLDRAPAHVQTMLRQRVEGPGLSAKGIAVFAALLQHLAREDTADNLRDVVAALGLPRGGTLSELEAQRAVDAHVASQVLARKPGSMSRKRWLRQVENIAQVYPNWPALQKLMHEALRRDLGGRRPDFAGLAQAAGSIGEQWGHWGDAECGSLKRELMKAEDRGSGRVALSDFYSKALHEGKWQLSESIEYLRQLGALDESSPANPKVIIPNYIGASGNCIASSDIMSVCCISECEDIMQQLEKELSAPEARPEAIAAAVSALASSTVPAGRELSPVMLNRLSRIAAGNDGMVPLHGRLFAQWLHHAYPRECPYPHLAGMTHQQQMEDFEKQTGLNITASESEMAAVAKKAVRSWKRPNSAPLEGATWSHREELFVPLAPRPDAWAALHVSVFVAALAIGTLGYALVRLARSARRTAAELAEANPSKLYPV